jgi:predicted phosphate transport protein (TIGR00153 family)
VKTLESWFKTRRKVQAIAMIGDHSKATVMGVEQLQRCINFAVEGRRDDLVRSFNVLSQKESEAAALKRRIVDELAKGDLPSSEREDLMRLARAIDSVIDWVNETGRILVEFHLEGVPQEIREITLDMIRVVKNCVIRLDECIGKLIDRSSQEALDAANEVEILEEETDTVYRRARGAISQLNGGKVQIGSAILLAQLMDALETIADRCEGTVDEVRVIVVTMTQ